MGSLVEMRSICKSFSGINVLQDVSFSLKKGEIHALMGENGAGKSTLMKILSGVYQPDAGEIFIDGKKQTFSATEEAQKAGVAIIHQELNLIPQLTVAENMFLGREFTFGKSPWMNWKQQKEESRRLLHQLAVDIDPHTPVEELSVGQQQMVEIAKALSVNARILVLDEPTAALTGTEINKLFAVMRELRDQGVGMVYISHRMEEIFSICDRITILRDGEYVGTRSAIDTTMDELVRMMVGREISNLFPKTKVTRGEEKLRVERLSRRGVLEEVSFSVHAGEIVGMAGLMGSGRTEVARAIFGVDMLDRGTVIVNGKPLHAKHPHDAIKVGIGFVTENRKDEGLVLNASVKHNLGLPNANLFSRYGWVSGRKERALAQSQISSLNVKVANMEQEVVSLSGGNQQKVVIGKWLAANPDILIMDEPTRGVDIGAKEEIYRIMNQLVQNGVAILFISSDMSEILGMSDRIIVLHEGRITGEFTRHEATQEKIMYAATGGDTHAD